MLNLDADEVARILTDYRTAPIEERLRQALALLEAMTKDPTQIDQSVIDSLRSAGVDDESIDAAANVGFHFNLINRAADSFDFPLLEPAQKAKTAKMLQRIGQVLGSASPNPSWTTGSDGIIRPVEIELARNKLLTSKGVTSSEMRFAAEAIGATALGAARSDDSRPAALPPSVLSYLEKVARNAYKVIDADVHAMRSEGLDDGAIFEMTLACAFGAAVAGLERVFAVRYLDAEQNG